MNHGNIIFQHFYIEVIKDTDREEHLILFIGVRETSFKTIQFSVNIFSFLYIKNRHTNFIIFLKKCL